MKKRQAKTPKTAGLLRVILAENVSKLLDHHYRHIDNLTGRQVALERDSGVKKSSIQRVMKCEVGANLETIEALAQAFHLSAYQILAPNLDAKNPAIIKGATADEQRMFKKWQHAQMTENA